MKREVSTQNIYDDAKPDVRVLIGSTTEGHSFSSGSISSINQEAQAMVKLFEENGHDTSRSLSLSAMITKTSRCVAGMSINQTSFIELFASLQLQRVIIAVNNIRNEPSLHRLLGELLDGSLDLLSRTRSKAKDTLWEIELLDSLRTHGIDASVGEPDLLLATSVQPISVACKKLYSTANFSKVLSSAVRQIERSGHLGIVAVNLDDLLPANSIVQAPNAHVALKILSKEIEKFMVAQERYLRKYIEPGRAIAVLVSCAALADLKDSEPRFCNIRQTVAWHIPSVSAQIDDQFSSIISAFNAGPAL